MLEEESVVDVNVEEGMAVFLSSLWFAQANDQHLEI